MKPLTERVVYHSVKGRRPSNQDSVVVGLLGEGRSVAAVADGMGGRLAGDVASQRALEVVVDRLREGDALAAAVEESNRAVFDESRANPDLHGMGTTVVAMLQEGDEYVIANVGDSRAYRLGGEGIAKVTADHSFTAEAIEAGEMTPEDAVQSPWANALTRAIGTDPEVQVDIYGPFDATESHAILLCSDGFHKPLSDEGILTSVLGCDANGETALELTDIALRAGSDDNITIALISFGDQSWMDEAIQARHDLWELEDAPTVEFQQEAEEVHASEGIAGDAAVDDPLGEDSQVGDPAAEGASDWVFPDPEAGAADLSLEGQGLIDAGVIGEGIAPMHSPGPSVEVDTSASVVASETAEEPLASDVTPGTPDRTAIRGRRKRGARPKAGFDIVVGSGFSLSKKQRRKRALQGVVLLAAVVAVVALALRFL